MSINKCSVCPTPDQVRDDIHRKILSNGYTFSNYVFNSIKNYPGEPIKFPLNSSTKMERDTLKEILIEHGWLVRDDIEYIGHTLVTYFVVTVPPQTKKKIENPPNYSDVVKRV